MAMAFLRKFGIIADMKMKYDLVFGFGPVCSCSQTLRRAGLQLLSFPFDWIGIGPAGDEWYDGDIRRRTDLVSSEFDDWLNLEDFVADGENTNGMYKCRNMRHKLSFVHDFPIGIPLGQSFPSIVAKYKRRTARLISLIRKSKRVLVVRLDRPDLEYRTPTDDCRHAKESLERTFAPTSFNFLLMHLDTSVPFGREKLKMVEPGIFRLDFDYRNVRPNAEPAYPDIKLTAAALAQLFSVKEYRTKAEIAAHRDAERRKRWAKYGATNAWQYRWRKLTEGKALFHLAGIVAARLRQQKIEQIIPIGTNCETTFRFFRRWGFVDSSLFAWAQTFNLSTLSGALDRMDTLPSGDFSYYEKANMWRHETTGTYFHGKMRHRPGSQPPSAAELGADLEDLRGRLGHLVEKFRKYAANDKDTLFVHKLSDEDAASPELAARLDMLEASIVRLGAQNWKLLVVCRKCDAEKMPRPSAHRLYRSVKAFNPGENVTCAKTGDPAGWNAIFTEFAPAHILPKSHNFKFE